MKEIKEIKEIVTLFEQSLSEIPPDELKSIIEKIDKMGLSKQPKHVDRNLLFKMGGVSNISTLTNVVCINISEKLSDKEIRDFKQWLQIIEQKQHSLKNQSKKFF